MIYLQCEHGVKYVSSALTISEGMVLCQTDCSGEEAGEANRPSRCSLRTGRLSADKLQSAVTRKVSNNTEELLDLPQVESENIDTK